MLELLEKEGEKEERKEEKKNPPFPFYPTFHFGGTSVVFLPDSHFARQQYTSSRRFDAVFRRIDTRGGVAVFCLSSPIYSPAIRHAVESRMGEGRRKGKNVFFENDSR